MNLERQMYSLLEIDTIFKGCIILKCTIQIRKLSPFNFLTKFFGEMNHSTKWRCDLMILVKSVFEQIAFDVIIASCIEYAHVLFKKKKKNRTPPWTE